MVFVVAVVAVALIALRPPRVPLWVWPVGAAALVVAFGRESATDALDAVARQWNVLLFIAGLMGLSAAAEESGLLAWVTEVVLARAAGSRRRLFFWLFAVAVATTLLLSNDATAIVLTPLAYAAVARRDGNAMPYLYACAFAANTASFGLPFSNPANVLILPHPQLGEYLARLALPQAFAIAWNAAAFALVFRSSLRGTYAFETPALPAPRVVRTLAALGVVGAAYFAALATGVPLGPVAAGGALLALIVAEIRPLRALQRMSWRTLLLVAGLFALLDAVARAGFVAWAIGQLQHVEHHGPAAASALTLGGAAVFSNLLNNLPVAIVASYVAAHTGWHHLAYPAIVGVDLGPNLSTAGSLATLLWLAILSERGVRVNPLHYARLGLVVVPPALAFSWLWFLALR